MFRVNREIFCLSGCHFPVSSITENGKDFLRYRVETAVSGVILGKAGRKALCRIYISRKRKQDAKTGSRWTSSWQRIIFRKVFVQTGKKWRTEARGSLQSQRASFYHGAKIRNSAFLPLAGNLLGSAFPKPCLSSSRTAYHSLPRQRESSFISSLVLSPRNPLRWACAEAP